jgi:calcium permeable stress-gated cation channel
MAAYGLPLSFSTGRYVMSVAPAGDPRDIFWRNVGRPHQTNRTGYVFAVLSTGFLCFFWSVPTAFVNSLTQVNTLKESLPKLAHLIEAYPWLQNVVAQLAPMILLFLNEVILPSVLKYFATWEGHISSSMLEASLFVKLGCFMVRSE